MSLAGITAVPTIASPATAEMRLPAPVTDVARISSPSPALPLAQGEGRVGVHASRLRAEALQRAGTRDASRRPHRPHSFQ